MGVEKSVDELLRAEIDRYDALVAHHGAWDFAAAHAIQSTNAADKVDALHRLRAVNDGVAAARGGTRPRVVDRDIGGRIVREAWVRWALLQPHPKPSWLVPYDELSEADKEADRHIAETVLARMRGTTVPDDVRRLVSAAREVAFGDMPPDPAAIKELDAASEAFASRVPWDDEPETAPVTTPAVPA